MSEATSYLKTGLDSNRGIRGVYDGGACLPFMESQLNTNTNMLVLPELLAPAGDWECAKAAVENGADAIYFGLEKFNARMRARNFTEADLPKLMEYLHRRGVKGYVTLNTLVFAGEMEEAERYVRAIIAASVDAAIVQDVGVCRLIRYLSPDFPIHASTQMTITSAEGVEFAKALGCDLVVLARECSIQEIEKINSQCAATGDGPTLPLEVFVHGALCVAYSGQCLTSEALGGRSANRGECAQACRMPYKLVSDGRLVPLGDRKYLLSPQDLAGLDVLPELVRAGVASLKIEGRLKTPEYVANITRVYRRALDDLHESSDPSPSSKIANRQYQMEMAFSRGLHTGWLCGINNQALVHARFGKKRGVFLGEVTRVKDESVFVKLAAPLKAGDGVVFDSGHPEENEEGGRVYEMHNVESGMRNAGIVELRFGSGHLDSARIHSGDKVWKTSDPELERDLRQTFSGEVPRFRRPISEEVHGCVGQLLTIIARDELGHTVKAESSIPLKQARRQPLTIARLREQLGRLGGTPFRLDKLENHLDDSAILPMSELNRMRRQLVDELEALRTQPKRWTVNEHRTTKTPARIAAAQDHTPRLAVLVRNFPQLEAALCCETDTIYCEFEDPKKYRDGVTLFRASQSQSKCPKSKILVAPPRIFKMGEEWILQQVRSCNADGYLVRNYDHLRYFGDSPCIGDYSFNIANALTAEYFKGRFRLERVTASYDLNVAQLEALLKSASPEWFEITIHQHIPMFHMEHCVFCAFLSDGTDFRNCGRPCDKHEVKLRDRVGTEHPLKADVGCRNTVFNALAQTGAEHVNRLLALGARHFRIEFLNETPDQVEKTISMYRQLLRGQISGGQIWRELKLLNQLGVTRGPAT